MASSFGGTIKLSGESEYRKAINGIISNLKVMGSEMQIVTATYGKNNTSMQALTDKNKVLNKQIETQKEKVDILSEALEKSKKETGENSVTTNKWQIELNKAKADLIKMTNDLENNKKQMQDNTKEVKNLGEAEDETGRKTSLLGDIIKANLISDAIKNGLSKLVDGIKAMGSALVDVGKQSFNSFADYEQLVGGVETLFKDSSPIVQEYANNAYKTSGLSANAYMETVTSFSASLLQSLDNDTAKAAKVADMAIIDMSDNANKMGTDMSMIQNAYQGFAKQNYTMLDNLKLGYGGTKSEMERLLADASKISGIKYNISNLSDVYNAIHVIQTELDITGTTAKEASTTIQGSMAAAKSAFQNLLVGVADDSMDLNNLINNFVDSIITAADNILPRVDVIIEGVGLLITDSLPLLLDKVLPMIENLINNIIMTLTELMPDILASVNNIVSKLLNTFTTILPQITTLAFSIINQLVTTLVENLPQIIEAGIQIIVSLIQGLTETIPTLIPTIIQAVITIVETLLDHLDELIDAGIQLLLALAEGLIDALPDLIDKIPEIIDKLIVAITNNLPKIIEAGIKITIKLAEGLIKAIPQLLSKLPQIITSIVTGLSNGIGQMAEVGLNMIRGLWDGIKNSLNWIKDKIKGWVGDVFKFIKKLFGINSPSRLFRDEIGINLAKGIGIGFTDEMDEVNKNIQDALPTDFDLGVNTTVKRDIVNSYSNDTITTQNEILVNTIKDVLDGMHVELDGEKVGKIVVGKIEEVVYT